MKRMTNDRPISYLALQQGTPVHSSDGEEVGKVTDVVADEQKDIFSGVAFKDGVLGTEHFAPADLVSEITETALILTIDAAQAKELGELS